MCMLNKKLHFYFSIVFSIEKMSKLVWSTYNTQFRYFLCLRCCQKRVKVEGIKEIMFLSISNATCKTQGYFIYIPRLFLLQSATPKSWNLLLLQDEAKVGHCFNSRNVHCLRTVRLRGSDQTFSPSFVGSFQKKTARLQGLTTISVTLH